MPSSRRTALTAILTAVVAIVAVPSVAAAAEETPHFIKGKAEVTEKLKVDSSVKGFYIKVPGFSWRILCEGLDKNANIGAKWESDLTLEFSICTVYNLEGKAVPGCAVEEPVTFSLDGQLVYKGGKKSEGEVWDVLYGAGKPFTGIFAQIEFSAANECALKGIIPIKGSAIALPKPKKPGEEAEVFKVNFSGESMPSGKWENRENGKIETAGSLTVGGNVAYLEGEILMELPTKEKIGVE
jgi:hypothetical protein